MGASFELVLSLLQRSFNVLVVDDDERMQDMVAGYLEFCSLFDVTSVKSVARAHELAPRQSWHCWLVDLYVPEIDDGLGLMHEFAPVIPIVALSGCSTGGEGFRCGQMKVQGFLDKSAINAETLIAQVFEMCLLKTLCSQYPNMHTNAERINQVFEVLRNHRPESVTQWASILSMSRRALEQWVGEHCRFKPSTVLALSHLYRTAFRRSVADRKEWPPLSNREQAIINRYAERPSRLRSLLYRTILASDAQTP